MYVQEHAKSKRNRISLSGELLGWNDTVAADTTPLLRGGDIESACMTRDRVLSSRLTGDGESSRDVEKKKQKTKGEPHGRVQFNILHTTRVGVPARVLNGRTTALVVVFPGGAKSFLSKLPACRAMSRGLNEIIKDEPPLLKKYFSSKTLSSAAGGGCALKEEFARRWTRVET